MKIKGEYVSKKVWINGQEIFAWKSQMIKNHSPSGFNWGYGGSGPAQLALAILLEKYNTETALRYYQTFKWEVIANLPSENFEIEIDLDNFVNERKNNG